MRHFAYLYAAYKKASARWFIEAGLKELIAADYDDRRHFTDADIMLFSRHLRFPYIHLATIERHSYWCRETLHFDIYAYMLMRDYRARHCRWYADDIGYSDALRLLLADLMLHMYDLLVTNDAFIIFGYWLYWADEGPFLYIKYYAIVYIEEFLYAES